MSGGNDRNLQNPRAETTSAPFVYAAPIFVM